MKAIKRLLKAEVNQVLNNLLKSLALDSFMKRLLGGILSGGGSFLGFASGGYTGDMDRRRVAGVVHGRDNTAATAKHRALLKAINSGKILAPAVPSGGTGVARGAPTIVVKNAPRSTCKAPAARQIEQRPCNKIAKHFEESAKSPVTEQIRLH